jgi:NAD(P)-dependent dehydrogenase (short-subunit alcohol dehydrogenase family)
MKILEGQTAIVSGAARGIGAAIAKALAAEGANVAVNDLREPTETVEAILAMGRKSIPLVGDVSDQAAVEAMVQKCKEQLGPVSILVSHSLIANFFIKRTWMVFAKRSMFACGGLIISPERWPTK